MIGQSSSVANVVEFRDRLDQAISEYVESIRPRLEAWRRTADPAIAGRAVLDAELEAHIRSYIVDPLLAALNWTTKENLTIETLVRSQTWDTRRRLDYLGIEANTMQPLLVVETKHPDSHLPQPVRSGAGGAFRYEEILAAALNKLKADAAAQTHLVKVWDGWLKDIRDYVLSLPTPPVRAAMTNGYWLVVFEDPVNAFIDDAPVKSFLISIYEDHGTIRRRASAIFESLNYNRLVPFGRPIEAAQIRALIDPKEIVRAMRALLVTYVSTPTGLEAVPTVHVVPEVLLSRNDGRWFRIRRAEKFRLPHYAADMPGHLVQVGAAHDQLFQDITAAVGHEIDVATLEESYAASWLGTQTPGVLAVSQQSYLVVTGEHTHFITKPDEYRSCPFHLPAAAAAVGAGVGVAVPSPSARHVTSFGEGTVHHCAHRAVRQLKEAEVNATNRDRYAHRGVVEDGPFCKIWPFERFHCCQTCAFRQVCKLSIAADLPCRIEPPSSNRLPVAPA